MSLSSPLASQVDCSDPMETRWKESVWAHVHPTGPKDFTHTQPEMWEVGVEILQGAIHTKNHSHTKRDSYMASRISTGSKLHTTNLL